MEIITSPDKIDRNTITFSEYEELLKNCNWDWDLLEDGSVEQSQALESYIAVQEYSGALRRKFIEDIDDPRQLKMVNSTFNKFAPDRYKI